MTRMCRIFQVIMACTVLTSSFAFAVDVEPASASSATPASAPAAPAKTQSFGQIIHGIKTKIETLFADLEKLEKSKQPAAATQTVTTTTTTTTTAAVAPQAAPVPVTVPADANSAAAAPADADSAAPPVAAISSS